MEAVILLKVLLRGVYEPKVTCRFINRIILYDLTNGIM